MDWFLMSVFLYGAALTHFLADFLSHWAGKKGLLILFHSFIYAPFFIPIFWFIGINYLWLILVFGSHLAIDSQGNYLLRFVKIILKNDEATEAVEKIIVFGMDQVIHLLVLFIIALIALR